MHPQLATFSLATHLHHPIPMGKTGRYYCCPHINSIKYGKQPNILWANPWISVSVCYTYLLTKPKSLASAAAISTSEAKEDCPFLSPGSFYLVKYALSFKMTTDWSGKMEMNRTLYWLATTYTENAAISPKKSFSNCAVRTYCHLKGKRPPL